MARSRLSDHPQFDAIVQALRAGGSPTTIARTYGVNADTLRSWWKRHRDDTPTPADEVRVSGTFSSPDAGAFTWDNVDSVPTDTQIRQVITLAGNDPDDFEWWVTSIDFSQNDTAWKRDRETAETMPGVKGTAYTGMAKRGKVSIKVERRKPDPAAEAALELADLARIQVRPAANRCATCHAWFDRSRINSIYCSARCRDTDRWDTSAEVIHHVVIPDTQVKPGVPTDHLVWAGRYIRENYTNQRLRIVHLLDHWDMESLSTYDRGKKAAENRRVKHDLEAGNRAFQVLDDAIGPSPLDEFGNPLWDFHATFGNHEDRINRYVEEHPELEGFLSLDNCVTPPRWNRHDFLKPVELEGIHYAHYFYQPNTGRPFSGDNIEARIRQVGHSFVMGHQQGLRMGITYDSSGKARIGIVAGSFYQHDEGYKGYQGNAHWRGIVVINNVEDGSGDPMPLSMDYLCRRYEGHRIWEHEGVEL